MYASFVNYYSLKVKPPPLIKKRRASSCVCQDFSKWKYSVTCKFHAEEHSGRESALILSKSNIEKLVYEPILNEYKDPVVFIIVYSALGIISEKPSDCLCDSKQTYFKVSSSKLLGLELNEWGFINSYGLRGCISPITDLISCLPTEINKTIAEYLDLNKNVPQVECILKKVGFMSDFQYLLYCSENANSFLNNKFLRDLNGYISLKKLDKKTGRLIPVPITNISFTWKRNGWLVDDFIANDKRYQFTRFSKLLRTQFFNYEKSLSTSVTIDELMVKTHKTFPDVISYCMRHVNSVFIFKMKH